jgi:hypothetical protein
MYAILPDSVASARKQLTACIITPYSLRTHVLSIVPPQNTIHNSTRPTIAFRVYHWLNAVHPRSCTSAFRGADRRSSSRRFEMK